MTPEQYNETLAQMKEAGVIKSDADLARQLGVHHKTIAKRRQIGADREAELALIALFYRQEQQFPLRKEPTR